MLERTTLDKILGVLAAVATISSPNATASTPDLASQLPETSLDGLNNLLDVAMTGAESLQMREIVEQDFEGRRLTAAGPQKLQLRGSANYRKEYDFEREEDGLGDRLAYSLALSKTVYHWGALEANRKKGEINLEMEELSTFEAYRRLALDVRRRYLQIVVANRDLELKQKTLDRRRANLELEQKRLDSGTASVVQVYNLELQASAAELDLLKAENSFNDQVDGLARLVGSDSQPIIDTLPAEVPEPSTLDEQQVASLSELFEQGVSKNLSIEQSRKSIDYYREDLHIAQQRNKPKFGVSLGVTQFELDEAGRNRGQEILFGGVSVSWNIFDSGTTKGSVVSALARIEQMKRLFETARSDYLYELERAQKLLDLNRRILERDEEALKQARKRIGEMQDEVDEGRAPASSLENVIISLASQEVRTNRSRSEYHNAITNMTSLLGLDPLAQKFIERRTR